MCFPLALDSGAIIKRAAALQFSIGDEAKSEPLLLITLVSKDAAIA